MEREVEVRENEEVSGNEGGMAGATGAGEELHASVNRCPVDAPIHCPGNRSMNPSTPTTTPFQWPSCYLVTALPEAGELVST
jgi:hypothetical protein